MSALAKGLRTAPAKSSKMGKPIELLSIVPGRERNTPKHKLYWSTHVTRTAEQYNSVITLYSKPCLRRWLEFTGGRIPVGLGYVTLYKPDPVKGRPVRYWTVVRDGEEIACYTNCIEAWLIVLSGEIFRPSCKWAMKYTDRSGRK